MKLAAALAASLAWTACSLAGPGAPVPIELGKPFSLRPGESARVDGGALRIGFVGVVADSRCPKGAQCVWAGDATVQIWVQQGAGPRESHALHTATGAAQVARVPGHELRLLRLDPYPVSGRPIAAQEPQATLLLGPDTGTEVTR